MRSGRHGNILGSVIICMLMAFPMYEVAGQKRTPKQKLEVSAVEFEGNNTFDDDLLLSFMVTRPSGLFRSVTFHPGVFETDLNRVISYYQQNGYLNAAVIDTTLTVDKVESTISIKIQISEGELTYLDRIRVEGNQAFTDSEILERIKLESGDPFRSDDVQRGMIAIASLYADSGYLDARIIPDINIDTARRQATIIIRVDERLQRMISDIRITGIDKTRPSVVRRELLFHPGESVHYSRLLESQRRLYLTGLFESVFIRPESARDTLSAETIIQVDLKEKLSSEFSAAVGYGSVEKVKGRLEVANGNLAGTGRQVGARIFGSFIKQGIELSFTEPWTLGTRWQTDLNTFLEYLQEPSFDLSRFGGVATIGRSFGRSAKASISFRFENSTLQAVRTTEVPEQSDPRVRSFSISYRSDTRDNLFDPTNGLYLEWTNEIAGAFLGGTNTFFRSIFRAKQFHSFNPATILGSSLEMGWVGFVAGARDIPINERFYAGGPTTLRGFDYQRVGPLDENGDPLGGRVMFVWNVAELRRAVYRMIGLAAFVDVGNVWSTAADINLSDIRTDVGIGLRANTPIGVVRIDYGVNLDPRPFESRSKIFFAMGQAF